MIGIQNSKGNSRFKSCPQFNRGSGLFRISSPIKSGIEFRVSESGITILLVVVILSALFSISIGIFNVVFGELRISGEIADSFVAFYAADQGIERTLYLDRNGSGLPDGYAEAKDLSSGGCYSLQLGKIGSATQIIAAGQYRCGTNPSRVVKRGFMVTY